VPVRSLLIQPSEKILFKLTSLRDTTGYMKRFVIEQSDGEFYTSYSRIYLVGLALNRFTSIPSGLAKIYPSEEVISHADVIKSYCGLLAQAKSGFVAIEQYRSDDFFRKSLGNKQVIA